MVEAARAFLESLTPAQRTRATFAFDDEAERTRWFYTPTDHGGLPLTDCSAHQQQLGLRLVASGLSPAGYAATTAIMSTEWPLEAIERWPYFDGAGRVRDPLRYSISMFGSVEDALWGWRFGGHHVSLNYTIVKGRLVSASPSFLGADPATVPLPGGGALRPLGVFEDLARDLVNGLTPGQLRHAILSPAAPRDLVTENRPRLTDGEAERGAAGLIRNAEHYPDFVAAQDKRRIDEEATAGLTPVLKAALRWTTSPKGIARDDLLPAQRELLDALVDAYLERLPSREIAPRLDEGPPLHFAWAGGTAPGAPHYYRVQAQRLLIEYDNTQRDANHIHSVWRDPEGDFGRDVLAQHYSSEHAR
jgi:hypothetical protein